jgi:hypothetical protein
LPPRMCGRLRGVCRRWPVPWQPANAGNCPLPDIEIPLGGKLIVGSADRAAGHAQVTGQGAGGRQNRAASQAATADRLPQCMLDAIAQAA